MTTAVADERITEAARSALECGEVRIPVDQPITGEFLAALSAEFDNLWFQAGQEGEIVIAGPPGGWVSTMAMLLVAQTIFWQQERNNGLTCTSNFGFHPPGGLPRIPDASWISDATLRLFEELGQPGLTTGYSRITPDFVIEVRSRSQSVADQQRKMEDWRDWGVPLGLLVEPESQTVYLYRPDRAVERIERPETVSCEPELPGLALDFQEVWALPWV